MLPGVEGHTERDDTGPTGTQPEPEQPTPLLTGVAVAGSLLFSSTFIKS